MDKVLDLNKTIAQLAKEDPEIIEIMQEIGFEDIGKPKMINTVGKVMTLPKGARMKKLDMKDIKVAFQNKGYEIIE